MITLVKYLCMSLVPLAAIASLVVHFLIKYDQIEVDDDTSKQVKKIENKAIKTAARHVTDIGIESALPQKYMK